jgi:GT2 family glycosyltransferase
MLPRNPSESQIATGERSFPPTETLDLSVVMVTWNSADILEECLNAVYAAARGRDLEVIVVDNGSTDGSADKIRRCFPEARLIANQRNLGVSIAFNQGMFASSRKYVQLLCSDTIVQPDALDRMMAFLENHPEIGALGPGLVYPDGRPQPSCRTFPTLSIFIWEFLGLSRLFPRHPVFGRWRMGNFDYDAIQEVDQPRGSSLMTRRPVIDEIGGWDESLDMFFNDVDWCLRIRRGGWKIYYLPAARMMHYGGSSVKKARPRMILRSHQCCYRFFNKHEQGLFRKMGVYALGLALLLSAGVRYSAALLTERRSG